MIEYRRKKPANIRAGFLIVVSILAAVLLIAPACAGSVHAEGSGWKFNATETTVTDPATGLPFSSLGALERALYPGLWNTMSPAARDQANVTPAESRSFDLFYTLNESQQAVSNRIESSPLTEADYLSAVLPDLWAQIPDWQKEQYRSEQHHSLSSNLPPVNGQFTGPFFPGPGSAGLDTGSHAGGFGYGTMYGPTGISSNRTFSGPVPQVLPAGSDIPVVPFGFAGYTTPFTTNGISWMNGPAWPLVPSIDPFAETGISHGADIFSGSRWAGWSAV